MGDFSYMRRMYSGFGDDVAVGLHWTLTVSVLAARRGIRVSMVKSSWDPRMSIATGVAAVSALPGSSC